MTDWQLVRLGDVVDFLTGFPFKSANYSDASSDPRLLRGDNIAQGFVRWDNAKRWPKDRVPDLAAYKLEIGDVVLAMDRPWIEAGLKYAAVGQQDVPSLLVQRVTRLRGTHKLSGRFLRYVIGSRAFTDYVLGVQTGTAVPHISGGQIKDYRFRLPTPSEQEAIADALGSLDDKIELNRLTSETLEAMAQAIFRDWFVDFGPTRRKIEGASDPLTIMGGLVTDPSRAQELVDLFPDRFGDEGLPEGWRMAPLSSVSLLMKRGLAPSYVDIGIPVVNQRCVRGRKVDWAIVRQHNVSKRHPKERMLELGDVLVNSTGVGTLGRVATVRQLPGNATCDSHVTICRPDPAVVSKVAYALFLEQAEDTISLLGHGSTGQTELKPSVVGELQIALANQRIHSAFEGLVGSLRLLSSSNDDQNRTLAATRDLLLPQLLSGEIRLRDAEKLAEDAA
ncbi:restriction endonuclease subunit S [Pelagibacterium luteolum]|uniref:Type I restriction enzyme, S subunit n=1 Tax=Pelagibacterium luteolum TaxID=440168 RepID=A0A1G7WNS6_9HYPH|nr:restriction endonuclease subunit S [Pelagibacterium luteolum]SDG73611.1 type I restriction enzyme, S subunit [Pelagibacterium luteolum]